MKRKEILENAIKCVCGDRDEQYGSPENSFQEIAKMWSAYLDCSITASEVAVMMALFKVARIKTGVQKDDSWIDAAGYLACGGEIAAEAEAAAEKAEKQYTIPKLSKEDSEKIISDLQKIKPLKARVID